MSQEALIQALCDATNFTKKACREFLQALPRAIVKLARNGSIRIADLGTFQIKDKEARVGRNPQTGESVNIPAKKVLTFRASAGLRDIQPR